MSQFFNSYTFIFGIGSFLPSCIQYHMPLNFLALENKYGFQFVFLKIPIYYSLRILYTHSIFVPTSMNHERLNTTITKYISLNKIGKEERKENEADCYSKASWMKWKRISTYIYIYKYRLQYLSQHTVQKISIRRKAYTIRVELI